MMPTNLSSDHLAILQASAIADEVISARGYRTILNSDELATLGFSPSQRRVPGLLLPLHTPDGGNSLYVYRPDFPRVVEDKRKGKNSDGSYANKVIKYEMPKGAKVRVDCPPVCQPLLKDPSIRLWITEGQKKADALASAGECAIALLGVWSIKGRNDFGGTVLLADFDYIAWEGREVRIIFDSDVMTKRLVRQAFDRLKEHLQRKKAHVSGVYLPTSPNGKKQGVDDFLAAGRTIADLEACLESTRDLPLPAAPIFELLDSEPLAMRRPLALINGRGYAAAWIAVKATYTETVDKKGEIVRHNPPIVQTERRLFVVRDDGKLFGDGCDAPLSDIGFDVTLPEIPPADKLWSAKGIKHYRAGNRPAPIDVFNRIVDIVSRFIDFERSLADQGTMAQFIACYVMATWFLDAFNVIGYIYPTGDRGSAKTKLLIVICEIAYLGIVILAGGSYATLRDLADYGATLAFDDAEGVFDPKRSDPDKRNLLLAGNRRGSTITVKEPVGDRWKTRYVNAFCSRLLSATRSPDPILASRSVIVPLIRTPDRHRANADPLEYPLWPHDRRELIDDLWALAVSHLHELPPYEARVNEKARLLGRNLEPWRAALAVALWLDEHGETGLWDRMEKLSSDYQSEREELENRDITSLVIRGLCQCAISAGSATSKEGWTLGVKEIAEAASQFDDDAPDPNPDPLKDPEVMKERKKYMRSLSLRVGRALAKMRLNQKPRPGGKGSRLWQVALQDMQRWTLVYGIELPDEIQEMIDAAPPPTTGTSGTTGTLAQPAYEDGEI